jgi:hypothetical protein
VSLSVSVGSLAWCVANGYVEDAEIHREHVCEINRVLTANGLPPHVEPETVSDLEDRVRVLGMPYSWLHYLRRAVAFARQAPREFGSAPDDFDPATDPHLDHELFVAMDSHLICHSDCGGFYVPIDFPEPLYDDRDEGSIGGILGSTQQALRELLLTTPLLGIRVTDGVLSDEVAREIADEEDEAHPYWIERKVWLLLFERFRHSIQCKAVVSFC